MRTRRLAVCAGTGGGQTLSGDSGEIALTIGVDGLLREAFYDAGSSVIQTRIL